MSPQRLLSNLLAPVAAGLLTLAPILAPEGTPATKPADPVAALSEKALREIVKPQEVDPSLVLVLTAREDGEVGPCGCMAHPGGGLSRKAGYLRLLDRVWPDVPKLQLLAGDWSAAPVDAGRLRTRLLTGALRDLGTAVANVGAQEVRGGADMYSRDVLTSRIPLVSSNLSAVPDPLAEGPVQTTLGAERYRILEGGGLRVGVLGLAPGEARVSGVRARDPAEEAAELTRLLRPQVDFLVALAILPETEAGRVARAAPGLDLLYAGWGSRVSPEPNEINGVPILYGGDRGRWLTEVRLYGGEKGLQAAEFVSHYLGEEVPRDPDWVSLEQKIQKTVRAYQKELAEAQAATAPAAGREGFRGAGACRTCHEEIWKTWSQTRHAGAFEALEREIRDFDPACQVCHVTGFGAKGGFSNPVRDRDLAGVQCESCHGPGAEHIRRPEAPWPVPGSDALCRSCHDGENDPDFLFSRDWKAISH